MKTQIEPDEPLFPNTGWRKEVNNIRQLYKKSVDKQLLYQLLFNRFHKLMLDVKHNRIRKLSNYERINLKEWGENWMRILTSLKNNDHTTTHPDIYSFYHWEYWVNQSYTNLLKLNPQKTGNSLKKVVLSNKTNTIA